MGPIRGRHLPRHPGDRGMTNYDSTTGRTDAPAFHAGSGCGAAVGPPPLASFPSARHRGRFGVSRCLVVALR